jgi:acyl-[acyl-carrier-protein]-phospholipid O-acyltransferase/long-chain-fatty-acid--[acyl-carrier-protein] ligase
LQSGIEHRLIAVADIPTGGVLHGGGPNLMSGYRLLCKSGLWVPPLASEGQGWHDTPDMVKIHDKGFVTIVGRTCCLVKIAGEMISLKAAERVAAHAACAYRCATTGGESFVRLGSRQDRLCVNPAAGAGLAGALISGTDRTARARDILRRRSVRHRVLVRVNTSPNEPDW